MVDKMNPFNIFPNQFSRLTTVVLIVAWAVSGCSGSSGTESDGIQQPAELETSGTEADNGSFDDLVLVNETDTDLSSEDAVSDEVISTETTVEIGDEADEEAPIVNDELLNGSDPLVLTTTRVDFSLSLIHI